jgi:hypothetical protein
MSNDFTQSLNSGAARKAAVVTPDTNNDLQNFATRGLLVAVTTAGTLVIDPVDGAPNQSLGTFPIGVWSVPVQAKRVRATSTLAGVITALY